MTELQIIDDLVDTAMSRLIDDDDRTSQRKIDLLCQALKLRIAVVLQDIPMPTRAAARELAQLSALLASVKDPDRVRPAPAAAGRPGLERFAELLQSPDPDNCCPVCRAPEGESCVTTVGRPCSDHAARRRLVGS